MWFPNTLVIKNTKLKIQTGYDQHEKSPRAKPKYQNSKLVISLDISHSLTFSKKINF